MEHNVELFAIVNGTVALNNLSLLHLSNSCQIQNFYYVRTLRPKFVIRRPKRSATPVALLPLGEFLFIHRKRSQMIRMTEP
jgi:hypothetical protein